MSLSTKLDRIVARAEELRALLGEGIGGETYVKASRELSEIEPVVARIDELRDAERRADDAKVLLADPEMRELAEPEFYELTEKIPALQQAIRVALLPR